MTLAAQKQGAKLLNGIFQFLKRRFSGSGSSRWPNDNTTSLTVR